MSSSSSIFKLGGDLLHDFRGATYDYVLAELDRRKADLKTQLVWVGAQKEPGITARTWRWVNGKTILFVQFFISIIFNCVFPVAVYVKLSV